MLIVTMAVVVIAVPGALKAQFAGDIGAAAAYVVNWVFAASSIDYLAQDDLPSVVQHYWSLSVEEQFYVLWPLALLLLLVVLRRRGAAPGRSLLVLGGALLTLSLAASVVLTMLLPGPSYFNTGVRAWEFLAGAMVAALAARHPAVAGSWASRRLGHVAAWSGIALTVAAVVLYTDRTPFPGFAALLPVAGTVLAIAAGANEGVLSLRRVSSFAPIRMLGDWSYSIYLWHWPMIVLFPLLAARPISTEVAIAIAVASIGLGAASKRFVEDPLRRPWGRRSIREFVVALVVPALLLGTAVGMNAVLQARVAAAQAAIAEREAAPCFGAKALDDPACGDPFEVTAPVDVAYAAADIDVGGWCLTQLLEDWRTCQFGDPEGVAGTMAFVGDSHAAALLPSLGSYFGEKGWRIDSFFRFGCPGLTRVPIEIGWDRQQIDSCVAWTDRLLDELLTRDDIDVVVFTAFTEGYHLDGTDPGRVQESDVSATWSALIQSGKQVVWVDDVPSTQGIDIPTCLATVETPVHGPCSLERESALLSTDIRAAAMSTPGVRSVEVADLFCDDERCYSVVGSAVAYADNNHISNTYARSIAPFLGERIEAAIRAG